MHWKRTNYATEWCDVVDSRVFWGSFGVFWGCFKSILRLFQKKFKVNSRVFQGCFKGVSRVFWRFFEGVLRMIQGDFMGVSSFKDVLKVIQICFRCFLIVSWGCFKGVSWESLSCLNLFNGCSKGVSMLFQDTCYLVHAIAIWYLLSNNCYLILAIWNFLSDTCYV